MQNKEITISRNLRVGALDAETDTDLLDSCFVDKGYLDQLIDVNSPASIVLGRTGSGKSALLYKVEKTVNKSIRLDPNDISIRFLENSDIIQFFDALNVNLDLFYRLLWRHLLTVEFLKIRYDIKNQKDSDNIFSGILNSFKRDNTKKAAIDYFREWGDQFWLDTDDHLREITQKLEQDTKFKIGSSFSGIKLSLGAVDKLSEQERVEIKKRATQVVNNIQIRKLNDILNLLSDHSFSDEQKKFYLIIDQLDEDWANTETRCRFIRALIEEIKTFRKIKTVKVIAALRKDLLDLVFDKTRDSGFQEEKYESYILNIRWSPDELKEVIELRVNQVFKSQYTNDNVSFDDIFPRPRKTGGQTAIDFLLERTLRRPRDILQFVNECFSIASDRNRISWRAMQAAEAQYSVKRLKSLKEEWGEMYPSFEDTVELLRGLKATFTRSSISEPIFNEVTLSLYERDNDDPCTKIVKKHYDEDGAKESDILSQMLICLYKVSAIGIKVSALETFIWSYIDQPTISKGEIKRANQIKVHKMLFRALDINVDQKDVFQTDDYD